MDQASNGNTDELLQDALSEFVGKWKLGDEAQQLLSSLVPDVQHKVVLEFNPRDTTRDANNIFMRFAQSISQAMQSNEDVQGFRTKWNLGEDATQILMRIEPSVRARVMREFNPRDTSSDVNNIFMKFASGFAYGKGGSKGMEKGGKGGKGGGKGFAKGHQMAQPASWGQVNQPHQPQRVPPPVFANDAQWQSPPAQQVQYLPQHHVQPVSSAQPVPYMQASNAGGALTDPYLVQFATKWNLQSEAQAILASLAPHAQQKVVQEFSPRDTSRDANNIFMKFATNIAQGMSGGVQRQQPRQQHPQVQQVPQQQYSQPRQPGAHPMGSQGLNPTGDVEAYLVHWRLGEEAQQVFYGLLPEQQHKVMNEFSPRDTQSDANNIFVRFCQGMARGISKGKSKGGGDPGMRFAPY